VLVLELDRGARPGHASLALSAQRTHVAYTWLYRKKHALLTCFLRKHPENSRGLHVVVPE
jgi:hypothetical protein